MSATPTDEALTVRDPLTPIPLDLYIDRIIGLREINAALVAALEGLANAAEEYMRYHAEKFYADLPVQPTGLHPSIATARAALALAKGT